VGRGECPLNVASVWCMQVTRYTSTTTITAQGEWENTAGFTETSSRFSRSGGRLLRNGGNFLQSL
jgi:hypothetical protein